jgi:Flp pilus assembly protein TadG
MNHQHCDHERGQVLIILVGAIIGLFALTALAIDGGMAFSDRRNAQNAADAAALAGAYAVAHDPGDGVLEHVRDNIVVPAAEARALANHFQDDANTTVTINYPPASGTYAGNPQYVQAIITSKVDTSLIHFAYNGEVKNTVEAVAHFTPATVAPLYNGNALVSLAPHECPGLSANGNFTAILTMGGIFVNSDCNPAVEGNSNTKTIDSPSLSSVGTIDDDFLDKGNIDIDSINQPAPQFPYPPGIDMVPPPDCAAAPDANYDSVNQIWSPPTPGGVAVIPGGLPHDFKGKLTRGVYCIDSGGFTFNAQADFIGQGVTLFITGDHPCDFTWNGGAKIQLYAPDATKWVAESTCMNDTCDYKGIVVYVDPKGFASWPDSKDAVIDGNVTSEVYGTIYAPICNVKKAGTSGMQFVGQVIGYTFQNIGTANLTLEYNANDAGKGVTPAYVDLSK